MIIRTLTLSALGAAALVLATASPAAAHNYVVDSTPAEGDTITDLPAEWSITTNEPMLALDGNEGAFAIVVTDADGLYYGDGCVNVEGDTMTAPAALGTAGNYTIALQMVSEDGHTLSEEFDFAYAPGSDAVVTAGSAEAPACGGSAVADEAAAVEQTSTAGDTEGDAVLTAVTWVLGGIVLSAVTAAIVAALRRRRAA